ncbi:MAG TPA: efflux RND transporter permease subunit [Thermoanaerobaculia bacterium]|nr:efflux RND transporter permease subunit [Thermoanaerobaculia bacterium]
MTAGRGLAAGAVRRPVATTMFFLVVVLIGAVAFWQLPVDLMPELTYPTLTVRTNYPNVGPQEVEDLVTRPIEESVAAVAGVEEITSTSAEGQSVVRVAFTWGTDLDAAAEEVRSRLDRIRGQLPEDVEPPNLLKFDLSSFPVLFLGVFSETMDDVELREFTEERIERRLERVPGVAAVDVRGGLRRQIRVDLDRDKLLSMGLSAEQVTSALRNENLNRPAGRVEEGNLDLYLRTVGEYRTAADVGSALVAVRAGQPIYLRDVAEVFEGVEEQTTLVRINGRPGIRVALNKQSGANTVDVAQAALAEAARIEQDHPEVRLLSIIDSSEYIQQAIANVRTSAVLGGVLAVLVLLFFLRSGRSTLVIATAIPISVVATFALVYFAGYTLNIMTFGGLALGVGMLVDNAVVVLENIFRKREEGADADTSAVQGTNEVALAITASTLTTLSVFLPILFMQGVSSVMYRQLAVVVAFSLVASLAVALTLIPMLSNLLLSRGAAHGQTRFGAVNRLYSVSGRWLDGFEGAYSRSLARTLPHRGKVILGAAVVLGLSLLLLPRIGSELMPSTDEAEVRVDGEMAVGTRLEVLDRSFQRIEEIVEREVPEIESTLTSLGGGGWQPGGQHEGEIRISLVDASERERSSEEIANDLRRALAGVPGVQIRTREGSGLFLLRIAFGGGNESLGIEIYGEDLATGEALAERVQRVLQTVPGVSDVRLSRDPGRPERVIRVDREQIARLGLSMQDVAEVVETNLAGTRATVLRRQGREYDVFVRLAEPDRLSLDALNQVTLVSATGMTVPLAAVADAVPARGPVLVERKDQERVIYVSANVEGRDLGSVAADVREALRGLEVPAGFAVTLGGDVEEQEKAQRQLGIAMLLALVLVYMVMAAQFENLFDPFVVMFSIPMALVGVLVVLWATGTTFNIQSYIGMIMLAGIVVNNAIVLVDYVNLLRRRDGLPLVDAVIEGARRRLRPILMTTLTTVLGLLPLAIGLGEGSELQAPMARAVIGGLTTSTFITLYLVPAVYVALSKRTGRGEEKAEPMAATTEQAA